MKFSEGFIFAINVMCTIEQWVFIIGSVWLIGWKDWSPWWFLAAIVLALASSPELVLQALSKGST